MDGELVPDRTIPYRDKKIIIYKDGRASFADIIFKDLEEAKFHVNLLFSMNAKMIGEKKDDDLTL